MRVVETRARRVRIPLTRSYAVSGGSWDAVEMVVVELVADDGSRGHGQASPAEEVNGETVDVSAAALAPERLDWLRGRAVDDALEHELEERVAAPAARAAIDMALLDLEAKSRGVALVERLGRVRRELETSITIGLKGVDETLDEAREYVGRGFRTLKVKTGVDVELDLERLARLRAEFGARVVLRADANQGYDGRALRRFCERAASLELELLEQPTPRGDEESWRALPEGVRRTLVADESVHDEADLERLASAGAPFGVVNVKLMKCGGVRAALRMARLARASGLTLMWGCMDESAVGIAAALHAALACEATRYLDLDGSLDLARDPFTGGFELRGGVMRTLARPGLGVEPTPEERT